MESELNTLGSEEIEVLATILVEADESVTCGSYNA